jgi:hypothetical protein
MKDIKLSWMLSVVADYIGFSAELELNKTNVQELFQKAIANNALDFLPLAIPLQHWQELKPQDKINLAVKLKALSKKLKNNNS